MNTHLEQNILARYAILEKELAIKNRELEIEAALEKVRTVAMAMRKPDDMLDVCRMISDQLQLLGFKEIRNVQTVIIYEEKQEYLNYQYFTPYDKNSIEVIDYRLHPDVLEFTEQMLQSADAYYTKTFEGKALEVWRAYRKQTAQLPDPKLDETNSSHYYFYSIGSGALGVTTYAALTNDQINLFKRFRNVFQLAYSRFTDIEKAEAQAKEARIETALERVRAIAMSMKKSEDLFDICKVMYTELTALNFTNIRNAQIAINLGEYKSWMIFEYSNYGEIRMKKVDSNISPLLKEIAEEMSKENDKIKLFQKQIKGEEFKKWRQWRIKEDALKDPRVEEANSMCFYLHGIEAGILGISSFDAITNEQVEILSRFSTVFDLSYTRYADVAKAEAQVREAQIEAALEKVRSRSLAMHNSDELSEVVDIVFKKLHELKIIFDGGVAIQTFAEGSKDSISWVTDPRLSSSFAFRLPYPKNIIN